MKKIKTVKFNNKKQKLIFVHFYNSYNGSPNILHTIIDSIIDQQSILITNNTKGFLSNLRIPTITFYFTLSDSKVLTLIKYFFGQIKIFFLVLKNCKRGDILYINTTIPMFASFAGKIKGATILFHLHEDRSSLNFIHRTLSKFRIYFCDVEIFVSKYLLEKEHIKGKKSYVLHNVVPKLFYAEAQKHKINYETNDSFVVLMICSLKKYKGVFEFLKIAKKLISFNDIKFSLLVSENSSEIDKFFYGIQLPQNVVIYEKTNDTIQFYKNASLLLNLSRPDEWIESFGLTILEGMTFGLPCIVPPVGGPVELIEDGINGYKISSYEIDNISDKILDIYYDKNLFALMSKNNKIKAAKYHFNIFQTKINQIIKETLQESKMS